MSCLFKIGERVVNEILLIVVGCVWGFIAFLNFLCFSFLMYLHLKLQFSFNLEERRIIFKELGVIDDKGNVIIDRYLFNKRIIQNFLKD